MTTDFECYLRGFLKTTNLKNNVITLLSTSNTLRKKKLSR